jgi:hypothetical protein
LRRRNSRENSNPGSENAAIATSALDREYALAWAQNYLARHADAKRDALPMAV